MIGEALKQLLLFMREFMPEAARPFVGIVATLVGSVSLADDDPRIRRVGQLVIDLLVDLRATGGIEDADVAMRLRLVAEQRFTRAWKSLGLEWRDA